MNLNIKLKELVNNIKNKVQPINHGICIHINLKTLFD